jgi:hypothetical protein
MMKIEPGQFKTIEVPSGRIDVIASLVGKINDELRQWLTNAAVVIHNQTKTTQVTVAFESTTNRIHIHVYNTNEDFEFQFRKEATNGTDSQAQRTEEKQKAEPAAGDRTESDPGSVYALPEIRWGS